MSFCPVVEIFPDVIDAFADADGKVYLDIDERTGVSLFRALKVEDDATVTDQTRKLSLAIPNTAKNYHYLGAIFDPNSSVDATYIRSRITTGANQYLYDKIRGITKSKDLIEIILELDSDWIALFKETKLSDIDLPIFELSKDDVNAKWATDGVYSDGDDGYFFPLVHYGSWISKKEKTLYVEDLRPFLNPLFLLQKMFAHIGWCFNSPFYETDYGRRLWCYILRKEYNNNEELKYLRKFHASKQVPAGHEQPMGSLFDWDEEFDSGNAFDESIGYITIPFTGSVILKYTAGEVAASNIFAIFSIKLVVFNTIVGAGHVIHQEFHAIQENETLEDKITVSLPPNCEIRIYFSTRNLNNDVFTLLALPLTIDVTSEVDKAFYVKGETIDLSKEIDQTMTCWDMYLALRHLISGISEVNEFSRNVTMYTPYDANIFGEEITGYFQLILNDLKTKQPINTVVSRIQKLNNRFVELGFKKSTDEFAKKLRKADGTELFLKHITLNDESVFATEEDRNNLFEGTAIRLEEKLWGGEFQIYLPAMWDNTEGNISSNIEPRILYCKGVGVVGIGGYVPGFFFEEQLAQGTFLIALAFNSPDITTDAPNTTITFNDLQIEERLLYGDETNDLWNLVYSRWFFQIKNRIQLDLLLKLNNTEFKELSFREAYEVEYDGHPVSGRILQLNDYKPCEEIPLQAVLLPEIDNAMLCVDVTDDVNCANKPKIITSILGTCYTFGIGGSFACNISTFTWEINSSETGGLWEEIGTGNTVEVCDHPVLFTIRVTLTYDCSECDDSILTKTIDPCFNNLACHLTQSIDEGGNICVQWSYSGNALSPFDFVVTINGGEFTDYVLDAPYLICGLENGETYLFTVVFTFETGCEELELECTITTSDIECNNNPVLNCFPVDENGIICYTFSITGDNSTNVETFIVTWHCDGNSGTWMLGDDPVCCTGLITASAIVFYCGCPNECTASTQCDPGTGCTIVSAGTPNMIAVCN